MSDELRLALSHATQTKAMLLGQGVLPRVAEVFTEQFPGKKALVVAHAVTWQLAGERVDQYLRAAGVEVEEPFVFTDPRMHAEWKWIEALDARLSRTQAIVVAVGSGTVNDTAKLCSHHAGRPYMVVATAASMDGYVASGASITRGGIKSTFACPAPRAVVADVDVVATAPAAMTASGYADLFAKVPAGADWIVADTIGIEPIDPVAWNIVQGGLHAALSRPDGCRRGEPQAIKALTEGLMLGGFAMQAYPQSSRPASGAEHQISHMLNMDNFVMANGMAPSHGFQVSIGTLVSLYFYEQFLQLDMPRLDTEACVGAWPSLEEQRAAALSLFADSDFPAFAAGEVEAKCCTPAELRRQIETMKTRWTELSGRLRRQLVPLSETIQRLKAVGAPVRPQDIDLTPQALYRTILRSQQIRRRYTIFDVAVRLGRMEQWASGCVAALSAE